jgi:hypothetical protein
VFKQNSRATRERYCVSLRATAAFFRKPSAASVFLFAKAHRALPYISSANKG